MSAEEAQAGVPVGNDNAATIVLVVVLGGLTLLIGYLLVDYYLKTKDAIPRPKKKLGAKKMKREKLKMGLRPAGDD